MFKHWAFLLFLRKNDHIKDLCGGSAISLTFLNDVLQHLITKEEEIPILLHVPRVLLIIFLSSGVLVSIPFSVLSHDSCCC